MTIPARCAYQLPQGKKLPWLMGTGKYEVCISPSQAKKLWGRRERPGLTLGCGAFACVYTSPREDRVIKITNDRSDVEALKKGQGIPFVPRVGKIFRLDSGHRWLGPVSGGRVGWGGGYAAPIYPKQPPTVYAVEVERVHPLRGAERGKWERRMGCLRARLARGPYQRPAKSVPAPGPVPRAPRQLPLPLPGNSHVATSPAEALSWIPKKYYPELEAGCCPKSGPLHKACQQGVRQIAEAARLLRKRGIDPKDLHAGNIGRGSDGRWKLIDLGQSGLAYGYGVDPVALQGARARKRKR